MRELEEVNTEIRNTIDIQSSVLFSLTDFPTVINEQYSTVEEKINVNSSRGGFLNDATYAWLSHDRSLVVFRVKTGESISLWTFKEKITCVTQFPTQPGGIPILLVGLSNGAVRIKDSYGMLCVFDCGTARVLRAITMPAGVEQVCIVSGGTEREDANEKRVESTLSEMDGIACVVLRNLHHILIDLQRSAWDSFNSVVMDEGLPAEMELCYIEDSVDRSRSTNGKHIAFDLFNKGIEREIGFSGDEFGTSGVLRESLTSTIMSSVKIGYVISGCMGRLLMWQNDGTLVWISPPVDEGVTVTHLALLEPTDDPRPFYYLCVILQNDTEKLPPLVRMYALLFDRKYCERGTHSYCNLEAEPSLKFEFELDTNDRVISLSTIERETSLDQSESGTKRDECNLLLISTVYKTLLFDLNQWYKEQMPQSIFECQNPNSILACYRTRCTRDVSVQNEIVSCTYMPSTLQEFPKNSLAVAEELYYPNSLSLEWVELRTKKLIFWASRGIQSELLRQMAIAGPVSVSHPGQIFQRCLCAGLVPFNTEVSFMSDQAAQRDMLLSLCLEQRWTSFLIKCAKEWSDGSSTYLYPEFLKWGVQRASSIKMVADHICVPLFDQSGSNIGESDVKSLRFCSQQLECLSIVVAKLPSEKVEFIKQRRALKRISMYFQVVLWFYDVGLLPESQDLEEGPLPMSLTFRVPYPFLKLYSLYKEKRDSIQVPETKHESEYLFIDELIMRECPVLRQQWEKESGDIMNNGYYPPPSLQSLLRSYLVDCCQSESSEMEFKHQITIYLLMDLAMLLQGSYPGVDQLIKYPSAFKMSPSVIKLTQAFWLLDHEDYQGFLDIMTGQLVSDFDIKDWHHKLAVRTLVRRNQHKLTLIYLRIRKPPLQTVEDQSLLMKLSVQHGLVQSAFYQRPPSHNTQLLLNFFEACKAYGKLGDILHLALDREEEEIFIKFLEKTESSDMRLLYYLQRCRYAEANNVKLLPSQGFVHPKEVQSTSQAILNAYNATLPDIVKRFSINMMKNHLDVDVETRCPRPMSHRTSRNKTMSVHENVIRKARETYRRNEKHQIPFISAPCVLLNVRSSDSQASDDCILLPKLSEKNNRRTLGQIYEHDNDSLQMPENTKRRKLEDDDTPDYKDIELNTPLVKPKSNAAPNKDICTETPQSILKIRQMIRSSTSPTVGSSCQINSRNSPLSEKDKKSARQIRFSLSQPQKSPPKEESIVQDVSDSNIQVSEESDGMFFSPNITPGSHSETAILSDTSYCKGSVYSPRPRSSLRRICLESSKDSVDEPVNKFLRQASLVNASIKTPSKENLNYTTPQISPLSTTVYTPSILHDDISFDTSMLLKRRDMQQSLIISNDRTKYGFTVSSTPLVSGSARKQPVEESINLEESADVADAQMDINGSPVASQQQDPVRDKVEEDSCEPHQSEDQHHSIKEDSPYQNCTYQNGDVAKNNNNSLGQIEKAQIAEYTTSPGNAESACVEALDQSVEDEEEAENDDAFESLSTVTECSVSSERKDRFSWYKETTEITETVSITQSISIKQDVDITDDESSNSGDDMVLALEESNNKSCANTSPKERPNLYEPPNITDDESEPEIAVSSLENNIQTRRNSKSNRSSKQVESEASEVASIVEENNIRYVPGTPKRRASRMNRSETANKTLQDNHISVTRSRRAASVTKTSVSPPTLDSPKATGRIKSAQKADSLTKEVLTASATIAEDNPNQSEDPVTTASPGKGRRRRTVSITKDNTSSEPMESPSKMPVRRSTRRAASVQKELTIETPDTPKRLTKKNRVSSTSSLVSERNEETANNEKKVSKSRSSSSNTKKAGTTRSSKIQLAEENQEEFEEQTKPETPVKKSRKRGSLMPKDIVPATSRTRRSSSLANEVIPEASPMGLETPKKKTIKQVDVVNSPAANTRSRRSSIQSIPEELEEILSMSSKERTSGGRKQAAQGGTRQRRAASVEPLQAEKKTAPRSTRNRRILVQPIAEEEVFEIEDQTSSKASNIEKSVSARVRAQSDTTIQNSNTMVTKGKSRRSRTVQEAEDVFLFSDPSKTDDVPSVTGDVPEYVFSPPHTRSRRNVSEDRFN